jgi:hypothetical protein
MEKYFIENGWVIDLEENDSFCRISSLVANTSVEVCFLCRLPHLDYDQKNDENALQFENEENNKEEEEDEEENMKTIFETEFGIYITKDNKKILYIEGLVVNGKLSLTRTYFLSDDMPITTHQDLYKKDLLQNLHNGLSFDIISEDIQYALAEYLIVYGLSHDFFFNLQKLSFMRENELYQQWLNDFEEY